MKPVAIQLYSLRDEMKNDVVATLKRVKALGYDGVEFAGLWGKTPEEMAARLYAGLREAEQVCNLLIAVEPKEKTGVMVGVLNRLKKACTSTDIAH